MWAWSPATCADCTLLGAYTAHDVLRPSARARVTLVLGLSVVHKRQVLSAERRDDGDLRHDLDISSRGPYRGAAGATSQAVLGRLPEVREVGTRAGLLGAESGEMDGDHRRSSSAGPFRRSKTYFAQGDVWNEYSSRAAKAIEGSETPMVAAATTLEFTTANGHDGSPTRPPAIRALGCAACDASCACRRE